MTGITLNDEVCVLADEVTKVETMRFKIWEQGLRQVLTDFQGNVKIN